MIMKYIIITEFGEAFKADELTAEMYSAANDGIIDIYRVDDMAAYNGEEFVPLNSYEF
jgi:hypothetical protein